MNASTNQSGVLSCYVLIEKMFWVILMKGLLKVPVKDAWMCMSMSYTYERCAESVITNWGGLLKEKFSFGVVLMKSVLKVSGEITLLHGKKRSTNRRSVLKKEFFSGVVLTKSVLKGSGKITLLYGEKKIPAQTPTLGRTPATMACAPRTPSTPMTTRTLPPSL